MLLTGNVNSSGETGEGPTSSTGDREGPTSLVPDEDQTGEGPTKTVEGPTGFDTPGEGVEGQTGFGQTGEGPTGTVEGPTGFNMTGEGVEGPSGFTTTGEGEGEGSTELDTLASTEPDTMALTEPDTQAATEPDTLDSKTFEGEKKIEQDCCWEEATCSTSSLTQDPLAIGDAGDLDFGIGFEDPEFDSRREGVFNEGDTILRERKATKSDDAAVPEYLWLEHLVEDGPSEWLAKQQEGLPAAMDLLRVRMLCWWKKCLTRSFWKWMKKVHPVVK
jgi:hypothetical protein